MLYESIPVKILLGLLVGSVVGSFVGMATWRWPLKQSWWGRSKCPACSRTLGVRDLVPVVSYFLCGGLCRCGGKISVRYPIIEGVTAILTALIFTLIGLNWVALMAAAFVMLLMMIIVIDAEHFIIPNQLVIWLFLLGLVWRWAVEGTWVAPIMGLGAGVMLFLTAFLAAFIVERMNEQESLGGGDLKLLFAAGPWVGFQILPALLIFSGIFGVVSYFIWKKLDIKVAQSADIPFGAFPYGPAICLAIYCCVVFEPWLIKVFQ